MGGEFAPAVQDDAAHERRPVDGEAGGLGGQPGAVQQRGG